MLLSDKNINLFFLLNFYCDTHTLIPKNSIDRTCPQVSHTVEEPTQEVPGPSHQALLLQPALAWCLDRVTAFKGDHRTKSGMFSFRAASCKARIAGVSPGTGRVVEAGPELKHSVQDEEDEDLPPGGSKTRDRTRRKSSTSSWPRRNW